MKNKLYLWALLVIALSLVAIVGFVVSNKDQKFYLSYSSKYSLPSMLGQPITSDKIQRFIKALHFQKLQQDQYAFLPYTRDYSNVDRTVTSSIGANSVSAAHIEIYTSKIAPLMIKTEEDGKKISRVSLISIGEYNLSGTKVHLNSLLLNNINEWLMRTEYYLPYEFLMISNADDAKKLLFYPYATRYENEYPEGFRIAAAADKQALKFPVEIWFDSDKLFCINFKFNPLANP